MKILHNKITLYLVGFLVVGLVAALMLVYLQSGYKVSASVSQGSDYQGTTTRSFNGTAMLTGQIINIGSGALGSVVITGAGAGTLNLYDATSTITNTQYATSTILLATFPLSAAAGTYTFDRVYFRGLVVEIIGTMPTSTITWR